MLCGSQFNLKVRLRLEGFQVFGNVLIRTYTDFFVFSLMIKFIEISSKHLHCESSAAQYLLVQFAFRDSTYGCYHSLHIQLASKLCWSTLLDSCINMTSNCHLRHNLILRVCLVYH